MDKILKKEGIDLIGEDIHLISEHLAQLVEVIQDIYILVRDQDEVIGEMAKREMESGDD